MYFLSLLCGMWSGSMEIGDFIWQFYISPPPHPHFHMLTLILTTQTLWRQEKKFIKIWTLWFFTDFLMPVSALHTDQFHFQISSLFTVLQFPFERSANLDVIFSFMGSSHGWLHWQDTNMKTSPISDISHHFMTNYFNPLECQGGIQSEDMDTFQYLCFCAPSVASGASPVFVCLSFCCTFPV